MGWWSVSKRAPKKLRTYTRLSSTAVDCAVNGFNGCRWCWGRRQLEGRPVRGGVGVPAAVGVRMVPVALLQLVGAIGGNFQSTVFDRHTTALPRQV